MPYIDASTKIVLDKVEGLLKDRFSAYVIVCIDGDQSYRCWSSDIFALGAAQLVMDDVKRKWDTDVD